MAVSRAASVRMLVYHIMMGRETQLEVCISTKRSLFMNDGIREMVTLLLSVPGYWI